MRLGTSRRAAPSRRFLVAVAAALVLPLAIGGAVSPAAAQPVVTTTPVTTTPAPAETTTPVPTTTPAVTPTTDPAVATTTPPPPPAAPTSVPVAEPAPPAAPLAAQTTPPPPSTVRWITDRRVSIMVNSPSMGVPIQVQILLARDWYKNPQATFPSVWMLDGLRARNDENGWTLETDAESWFADKNVNVILPVGGQSSFYSDWQQPDNGVNYQFETFLTKELPAVLEGSWRTNKVRAVAGLSMGGTAAMALAARNPGFFKFAGSYSGILTTTTLGMPQAVAFAMRDAGNFDANKMWGPPTDPAWPAHDPYSLAEKLRGVSIYVSSGSGLAGPYDQPSGIPGISTNTAGAGLEILARLTSQTFATRLNQLGIPASVNYRPSGTHSWPYWNFEYKQSWPQMAAALGVEVGKPNCGVSGAIAGVVAANGFLGDCLTDPYPVTGGTAQDFRFGRVFSSDAGTAAVAGAIGGAYSAMKGPDSPIGLPTTSELVAPDGRGRFNSFQKGMIYWTPQTGAHAVRGAILDEWAAQGYERGPLGYPVADEIATPSKPGAVQGFEVGAMYWSPTTGARAVLGRIMAKYASIGFENSPLGFPQTNEVPVRDGGRFTQFEGGNIYWSPITNAWVVLNGPIFDAWKSVGYEAGRIGYPISDVFPIAGGVEQNFQFGFITLKNGQTQILP